MAIDIQVGDIIDGVQFELHLPGFSSGDFITTDAIGMLVRASAAKLSGIMTRLYSDALFAETATLTAQAGLDLVSLPANMGTLRSVHWIQDSHAYELCRADLHEFTAESESWGQPSDYVWNNATLPRFTLEANVLRLVPTPSKVYTLRIAYTTGIFLPATASYEDLRILTFPGQIGWKEWMIADIAYRVSKREQKDGSVYLNDMAIAEAQMKDHISQRDRYSTYQVRDTRNAPDFRSRRRWGY
jgi:hypothetical protein